MEYNKIRVLYVEDEQYLRDLVTLYLEELIDCTVKCASNGQTGVELANSWQPDFILMDVRMPIMTGPEAIRILRNTSDFANTPIYALTAYSDEKALTECKAAGADGDFIKPPDFDHIAATIIRVVTLTPKPGQVQDS